MTTPFSALARTGLIFVILAAPAAADETSLSRLTLLDRAIMQDQGDWQVDYRLRHDGASNLVMTPETIAARVEGWVSNSRASGHSLPRWSSLVMSGASGLRATAEIIATGDEEQHCAERSVLSVVIEDTSDEPGWAAEPGRATAATATGARSILNLSPGKTVGVRLRLEHHHVLYGDYNPLLGARTLELSLGSARFRDALPLETERHLAVPKPVTLEPANDRRDTRYFASAPDSLHIEAHISGNESYHFPEQPVRYATKMRLRFWYLIAPGTEGECRAQILQYKDLPNTWKVLSKGQFDVPLITAGRWAKVEHVFQTESDATTLSLQVRIDRAEVGELWIDDVTLAPLDTPAQDP